MLTSIVVFAWQDRRWNAPPVRWNGEAFLLFYVISGLAALVLIAVSRARASKSTTAELADTEDLDLSTDELAVLSGGLTRLMQVSLARLYFDNQIEVVKRWFSHSLQERFVSLGKCLAPIGAGNEKGQWFEHWPFKMVWSIRLARLA